MEFFIISLLNGISYGLLLFMLSSGLTLIFSMMGVLNFAHASFYMLGAYFGYSRSAKLVGFWPALVLAPLVVGGWGRCSSATACARCTSTATCPSCWSPSACPTSSSSWCSWCGAASGRPPPGAAGPAFTLKGRPAAAVGHAPAGVCLARRWCAAVPATFMMLVALVMLLSVWLLLTRTRIGLVIQAALTHPTWWRRWATTCRACSCWCSAAGTRAGRAWPA
jgi:branched-chain amino acid transport system permease protein